MSASPTPDTSLANSSFASDSSSNNNNNSSLILQPESPLDVLSRAASMVESSLSSSSPPPAADYPTLPTSNNAKITTLCTRTSSFKERHPKFRKNSTPDYIIAAADHHASSRLPSYPLVVEKENQDNAKRDADETTRHVHEEEGPLDMSIKKQRSESPPLSRYPPLYLPPVTQQRAPPPPYEPIRPPPPSYESSIVKSSYPSPNSVRRTLEKALAKVPGGSLPLVTNGNSVTKPLEKKVERTIREITIITDSSADPLLDEHFKRSLGENYNKFFKEDKGLVSSTKTDVSRVNLEGDSKPEGEEDKTVLKDPVVAFKEDLEGYTVEDHFAKALGQETWLKLQQGKRKSPDSEFNSSQPKSPKSPRTEDKADSISSTSLKI